MRPATGTLFPGNDSRQIAGPEPNHRKSLPGERRHGQFPELAVGKRLFCVHVKNFNIIMVFPNMNPLMSWTVHSQCSDPTGFRHAVNVERFDSET